MICPPGYYPNGISSPLDLYLLKSHVANRLSRLIVYFQCIQYNLIGFVFMRMS